MNRKRLKWYEQFGNFVWRILKDAGLLLWQVISILIVVGIINITGKAAAVVTGWQLDWEGEFFVGFMAILLIFLVIGYLANCWHRGNSPED